MGIKNIFKDMSKKKKITLLTVSVAFVLVLATVISLFAVDCVRKGNGINRITVSTLPTKTQFYVGENADFSGLTVEILLNNGKTQTVDYSECNFYGFDSSKPQERMLVQAEYQGHYANFYVNIVELPAPLRVLQSIELESLPNKTEYQLNDSLSVTGGVILLRYSNGETQRVNLLAEHVHGFNEITQPGTYTLRVLYAENGVLRETSYQITVS